jgi:hypothetical protein
MNTTTDEREKWNLGQNEAGPDLPKLASPCCMAHLEIVSSMELRVSETDF